MSDKTMGELKTELTVTKCQKEQRNISDKKYAWQIEFSLVQKIVFSLIALIVVAVIAQLVNLAIT